MITITKKADATGCPLLNGGSPPGCIPIVIVDDTRTSNGWLRNASPLFPSVDAGGAVVVNDAALVIARANDLVMCGGRTAAELAADNALAATESTESVKLVNARNALQAYLDVIRAIAPGSRTVEQRGFYALAKLFANRE